MNQIHSHIKNRVIEGDNNCKLEAAVGCEKCKKIYVKWANVPSTETSTSSNDP